MTPISGDICGEIRLRARAQGGVIVSVEIASTRPAQAARIFEGRPVAEACDSIGRVFSLCGTAQTIAALTAAEEALGIAPVPGVRAARDLARLAEMLTQTTMRLALHWPRALGLALRPELVRACLAAEAAIAKGALGPDWRLPGAGAAAPVQALAATLSALDALLQEADPGAALATALARLGLDAYGTLPEGTVPEAGALRRYWDHTAVAAARAVHGTGLAARLAAARAEFERLPSQMIRALEAISPESARAPSRQTGQGEAIVETARGPLVHRLTVEEGIVTACVTAAPTEANFAADGAAAAGLIGQAANRQAAELHVLAIDPCVAASVEIDTA